MDQFLDEFIAYAQEILGTEILTPEAKKELAESKTKKDLIESKVNSFLKRMGYSDEFIGMLWSFNIYGSFLNIKFNFPHIFNDKSRLKDEYQQSVLSSFRLLHFSLSKNHIKERLEDKFRIYYTMEDYPPYQIDRRIEYLLFKTQSYHFHNIGDILVDVENFEKNHKFGNLLEIKNALDKLVLLLDSPLNPGLKPAIIEYLQAEKCSEREIEGIYTMIKDELDINMGIIHPDIIEDFFTANIKKFRINTFLNSAQDTLENIEDETGEVFQFINYLDITDNMFNAYVNNIFIKKMETYIKENNNFTVSSVKEFLFNNKALSQERFDKIIARESITIQPDPNINPETGESFDHHGNVLPNCAICFNILNANIPEEDGSSIIIEEEHKFSIERLRCGGLFHLQCITDFKNKNGQICPTCGK
jgi:hypothetical protein